MLSRHVAAERARLADSAIEVARHFSLIIDAELGRLIALITGLASSSALRSGDMRQFREEAARLVAGTDQVIVLREFGPRQLVNTQVPLDSELPLGIPIPESEQRLLHKGSPVITGVYASPVDGEPRIAVAIAVKGLEGDTRALGITVPTAHLHDALPKVPDRWIVGVGDPRSIKYITRSQRHGEVSGKPADPAYFASASAKTGSFTGTNLEGIPVLVGYAHGDLSGWLFAANVPQQIVEAPLRQSLYAWGALGAAALLLSLTLAWLFGRNVTEAGSILAQRAAALGAGGRLQDDNFRIAEFHQVSEALTESDSQLQSRDEQRQKVERQRQQLIAELDHRAKNTLAVVQSVLTQTLRHSDSLAEAKVSFSNRIRALAAAHDILTREHWGPVEFREILASATAPYGEPSQFAFGGPDVRLVPSVAVSIAMVLNELATNATKYGALSVETGSVTVSWKIVDNTGKRVLRVRWKELGGPKVASPSKQGFGTRLIQSGLSGQAHLDYAEDGIACSIELYLQ
jgi:two-component sensor histidine kinase